VVVFKENADRRIVIGMLAIVAGGVVLSWPQEAVSAQDWTGPLAVAFACFCWAIDNNLTRKVSASDALFIAGSKGLVAGLVNCTLALFIGQLPAATSLVPIMLVGFRLRRQPGNVRPRPARPRQRTHRRLLFHRTVPRRRHLDSAAGRIDIADVPARSSVNGRGYGFI
jgi:hypothetical protein